MAGVSFLFGQPLYETQRDAFFSEGGLSKGQEAGTYNVFFGTKNYDVTKIDTKERTPEIEINAIFSSAVVYIDPNKNYDIKANCAFGSLMLPKGRIINFGKRNVMTNPDETITASLDINVVFGRLNLIERPNHPGE